MANHIRLRLAREDDYAQIVDLSQGIYIGEDYLPSLFHRWIKTPNKFVLVGELDGKVIGLQVVNIIADEKACFTQSLRVHPEHRGKGYGYQIVSAVNDFIRQKYPKITKKHFTVANPARIAIANKMLDKPIVNYAIHEVQTQLSIRVLCEIRDMYKAELHQINPVLIPYAKNDAIQFILNEQAASLLFDHKMLLINWLPYEATQSNVELIFQEGDRIFSNCSVGKIKSAMPMSFSHGRLSSPASKTKWHCTIYTNDLILFKEHLKQQIMIAIEEMGKEFNFSICHPKCSSFDGHERKVLEETFSFLGIKPYAIESRLLVLYETNLYI